VIKNRFSMIRVRALPDDRRKGRLTAGPFTFRCALGKGGITRNKREGDGGTPAGCFALRRVWWRADRMPKPRCNLPKRLTTAGDGWCDASGHPRYNRPVALPFAQSHEKMWRDDHLYDVVIEIGWNDRPAIQRRGSAIFFHIARSGYTPTEGCVAITMRDMQRLLPYLGHGTKMDIR
jgi:L,D-peptidoglycan transpeptidase YkuD (ErfK/YbiS/YcfS/YnhG family)